MRGRLAWGAVAALLVAAFVNSARQPAHIRVFKGRPVPEATYPAVLPIIADGKRGSCTAFVLQGVALISARHCFKDYDDGESAVGVKAFVQGRDCAVDDEQQALDLVAVCWGDGGPSLEQTATPAAGRFTAVGLGQNEGNGYMAEGTSEVSGMTDEAFVARPSPDVACEGDSGGPALSGDRVFGVASGYRGGERPECGQPVWYTRLDSAPAQVWLTGVSSKCAQVATRCGP